MIGLGNSLNFPYQIKNCNKSRLSELRFPAPDAGYHCLVWLFIGSYWNGPLLWLAIEISFVLFVPRTVEMVIDGDVRRWGLLKFNVDGKGMGF